MSITEERAPLGFFLTDTEREALQPLVLEVEAKAQALAEAWADVRDTLSGPVHVDLGLAEAGVAHQQAFPPCGPDLRTHLATADELIIGDRAVPVERMVVGPAKDAFAHFHRIDATTGPCGGQVVLGWDGEDRVVACDWPFARVSTGRIVTETEDGPVAYYEWETGR